MPHGTQSVVHDLMCAAHHRSQRGCARPRFKSPRSGADKSQQGGLATMQFGIRMQEADNMCSGEDSFKVAIGDNRQLIDIIPTHHL
jgi:hypothetical protein